MQRPCLTNASRIVIKTGSALVTHEETGRPHTQWMATLADDIAALHAQGKSVVLVSSGAVSLGRRLLGLTHARNTRLQEKQAAAACGQVALMDAWREQFARHGIKVGQLLLTLDTSERRSRYLNARNTFETLLSLGVLPIVNENDTVTTAELRFGDNDRLAARVAEMVMADALVLLSDIDGFYTADPTRNPDAKRLDVVGKITPEIAQMAGKPSSSVGSGGMVTKLAAAQIAQAAGCHMLIAAGKPLHPLSAIRENGSGTWFIAEGTPISARKRWIAGSLNPAGSLTVDAGAAKALTQGKSLLAAGVTAIEGDFDRGDAVWIKDTHGHILGKGLVMYNAEETQVIRGHRSEEFEALLGYQGRNSLIHRDDLVLQGAK